ncbi:MAG: MFS transporter [Verrucomicrobiota bacterium]
MNGAVTKTNRLNLRNMLAAFKHRNYRLFFAGQGVSLVGTWMQNVAQGWLVYDLTRSTFLLGFVTFISALPVAVFTLLAGVVADRHNKRTILIANQTAAMLLAFLLATLVHWHVVTIWHIAGIGLLTGIATAFDMPTRQSFVVEMVGKEDLLNAIALNSSMFHTARICGPALAGLLIASIGAAGCFALNGLSFLAVIAGYAAMRMPAHVPVVNAQSFRHATMEALRYVWGDRHTRVIVAVLAVMSVFGTSHMVLMPVFAREVLQTGVVGLGYLMAANGLGALLGALTLASMGEHRHQRRLFFNGLLGFCIMVVGFAWSRWFWLSVVLMVCVGFCMIIAFATANTSVQMRAPDHLRGRVMGVFLLAFIGLNPFGALLAGALARATNVSIATTLGELVCLAVVVVARRLVPPESLSVKTADD